MTKKYFSYVRVCAFFLGLLLLCGCYTQTDKEWHSVSETVAETVSTPQTETDGQKQTTEDTTAGFSEETEMEQMAVYVCGAVINPGVYYLTEGSRITDAVFAAGGLTTEAAPVYLNLADRIHDGQKIYVPTAEEAEKWMEDGIEPGIRTEETSVSQETGGLVNINTASRSELMRIPGIGETKADAIVAFRESQGAFKTVEEVMLVPGIKEGAYEKMKDWITIGSN